VQGRETVFTVEVKMTISVWQTPSHIEARDLVYWGCNRMLSRGKLTRVTEALVAHVQAIGWLETGYASKWKEPGVGSCNWGAVQHKCPPCRDTRVAGKPWERQECFSYADTTPQADGSSKRYSVCFRRWPSMEDGVLGLIDQVVVRRPAVLAAALAGKTAEFSAALHATRYYEGYGATVQERIKHHYDAVCGSMRLANAAIAGRPPPTSEELEIQATVELVGRAFIAPLDLLDLARDDMRTERDRTYLESDQ
jgi:hypothetical protein